LQDVTEHITTNQKENKRKKAEKTNTTDGYSVTDREGTLRHATLHIATMFHFRNARDIRRRAAARRKQNALQPCKEVGMSLIRYVFTYLALNLL